MTIPALYTWRDVARIVTSAVTPPWSRAWCDATGLFVSASPDREADVRAFLATTFESKFDAEKGIALEGTSEIVRFLPVVLETAEPQATETPKPVRPLWPDALVDAPSPPPRETPRLIAFYSYKGGVGRTTSILGMLGALLARSDSVLLVDADIEAPGATWLLPGSPQRICLLDVLGLVHDEEEWTEQSLPLIESRLRQNIETVELPVGRRDFYFLPAFRDHQQLFDARVDFEQLVRSRGRSHVIADLLFELGTRLTVNVVLIDLRAGITEFSSPLLLDPRVQSVLVTSSNTQSVQGTLEVLRRMAGRIRPATSPEVILTMIPPGSTPGFVEGVEEGLLSALPASTEEDPAAATDAIIHRIDFAQDLLHFDSITDLLARRTPGTDLGRRVAPALADRLAPVAATEPEDKSADSAPAGPRRGLTSVIDLAKRLEYAEQNAEIGLLPIPALEALVQQSVDTAPAAVVLGSKGAGKTFAWAQMVISGSWNTFAQLLGKEARLSSLDRIVFPVLAPSNLSPELAKKVAAAEDRVRKKLKGSKTTVFSLAQFRSRLERSARVTDELTFWTSNIALRLGLDAKTGASVAALAKGLEQARCSLVLVVDGLEDAFQFDLSLEPQQRLLLRGLLQRLTVEVRDQSSPYLGIVSFVRRDLAEDAVLQNFGQFEALHSKAALTWSPTDALRLPAWILARAGRPVMPEETIPRASYETLQAALQGFWGARLGSDKSKEAYTDRWIIAALSDLQGRLQPRDLVRLIRRAAELVPDGDRLTPLSLRSALPFCSEQKIKELETEVRSLKALFDRFRKGNPEKKAIPFSPSDFRLRPPQVEFLKKQGIVTTLESSTELYMPEIIRQGLGFKLKEGRRAKVLALYRAIQAKNI